MLLLAAGHLPPQLTDFHAISGPQSTVSCRSAACGVIHRQCMCVLTRQGCNGGRKALSARHPYQTRGARRGVGLVSALLDRRSADPEGVIMRAMWSNLAGLALVVIVIVAASPSLARQNNNPLPPGDGRDVVSVACSQCHYLGTIAKIRDGAPRLTHVYQQHGAARREAKTSPTISPAISVTEKGRCRHPRVGPSPSDFCERADRQCHIPRCPT
jgi:hypothetical protein